MTQTELIPSRARPASAANKVLAWVLAAASVAFAVVNVGYELSGRFDEGSLSAYASGISVANWLVVGLKGLAGVVAVLTIAESPRMPARLVNILIWGAAGTLGVYSMGSVAQAVGMATGLVGARSQIDAAGLVYVLAFLLAAVGFVVLATSHSRRSGLGARPAIIGIFGGILTLGIVLLALPMVLTGLGIMPSG